MSAVTASSRTHRQLIRHRNEAVTRAAPAPFRTQDSFVR